MRRSCRSRGWSAGPGSTRPPCAGCERPRRAPGRAHGRCVLGWRARSTTRAWARHRPCRTRKPATSSTDGVDRVTRRQRERIVGRRSSTVGAHSIHTVRSVGSSIALSSALAAWSVSRSASSTIITCQRRPTGASAERRTRSRTSSTPIESLSVRTTVTSAWLPASTVWHEWQVPQPGGCSSHCSAAAKATAALERPEPGGPVKRNAWLMPWPGGRAAERLDRPALADQRGPDRPAVLVVLPGRPRSSDRLVQQRLDAGSVTTSAISSAGRLGIDHEVVVGVGGGERQEGRHARARRSRATPPRSGRARRSGSARAAGSRSARRSGRGRRSRVAQRATRSTSTRPSARPAPW